MSYLDTIRDAMHAELPGLHPDLIDLYALLALTKGEEVTLENVHDAWGLWTRHTRPDHPSLVPFSELEPEVQELDELYVQAIKAATARTRST